MSCDRLARSRSSKVQPTLRRRRSSGGTLAAIATQRARRFTSTFFLMSPDPVESNPANYSVILENHRVRVLKYHDEPGTLTLPHDHPDSVMITASSFRRRLIQGERTAEMDIPAGRAMWLAAQSHAGHNIGETDTDVFFVELKEPAPAGNSASTGALGPVDAS